MFVADAGFIKKLLKINMLELKMAKAYSNDLREPRKIPKKLFCTTDILFDI